MTVRGQWEHWYGVKGWIFHGIRFRMNVRASAERRRGRGSWRGDKGRGSWREEKGEGVLSRGDGAGRVFSEGGIMESSGDVPIRDVVLYRDLPTIISMRHTNPVFDVRYLLNNRSIQI